MKYAVVGGHNEIVPGASGCGYKEHEVARQMVAKVLEYFAKVGESAYNCTDDEGRTPAACWQNAVRKTNQCIGSSGLAISIHLNAANGSATGTEVLHYDSPVLAQKVSAAIASVLGIKDRGPKDGKQIGYINSTKSTAILIELCFIDNPSDMDKLMQKFDAVARVIVETVTGKKIPAPAPSAPKQSAPTFPAGIYYISTGGYAGTALMQVHEYLARTGHNFDCKRGSDGSIVFLIGRFDTSHDNFKDCEKFLRENGHGYELIAWEKAADWK